MGPRNLQALIHSSYATGSNTWSDYRSQIKSMYESSPSKEDFNDHLIREFNKKINRLNQSEELYIAPYDGGFRFVGDSISLSGSIEGFAYPNEILTAPTGSSYTWTVAGETRGTSQTFTPTVYDIGETVTVTVDETTYTTTVWHPRDIASVKAFWWAAKNAYNIIGNNYTDSNRSVIYSGIDINNNEAELINGGGINYNGTYSSYGIQLNRIEGESWSLEIIDYSGPDPEIIAFITSTSDSQYPWNATWPEGTTITPTATTYDVLATDGQTVPTWKDLISNQTVSASGLNIALKEDTDIGSPSLRFDSTDFYTIDTTPRSAFNGKRWGYIFAGAKDNAPMGGDAVHGLVSINRNTSISKIGLRTRNGIGANTFTARTARSTTQTNVSVLNDNQYNVLVNESLWTSNRLALRLNGIEAGFSTLSGGAGTADFTTTTSFIGSDVNSINNFNGDITAVIFASNVGETDEMSATDLNRIERFIGLLGGLNIPLT